VLLASRRREWGRSLLRQAGRGSEPQTAFPLCQAGPHVDHFEPAIANFVDTSRLLQPRLVLLQDGFPEFLCSQGRTEPNG
jgi:hypothetical protein